MSQLKLIILSTTLLLNIFVLNTTKANSSFPNALPKTIQKEEVKPKVKRSFLKRIKRIKRIKKRLKLKNSSRRIFSKSFSKKEKSKNHYGKVALWTFILAILSLFLTINIGVLAPILAIASIIVSFIAAKRGANGADKKPKLAEIMFTIHLALYAFIVLILAWFIVLNFL